jgi:hypothetical protein
MFKRILPAAGAVGLLSVALAGTALAGGEGGYGRPGHFQFSDTSANASFSEPSGDSYASNVYVDRGQLSFKLKRTPGAPVREKSGTVMIVNEYSATTAQYGCWVIPDSAFTVARDLSSARVSVHATADMQCPGVLVGSATGGKPGLQSSIGYGGGGQPPTAITDITVNLAWTGNGALWKNSSSGTSKCGSFTANFHSTFDYEYATATGSIGDVSGVSDPFSQVGRNTLDTNSSSTPSAACNPFGF